MQLETILVSLFNFAHIFNIYMENLTYHKEYLSFNRRLTMLWCAFILCLVFTTIVSSTLPKLTSDTKLVIYSSILLQNLCVFIVPALLTAFFITPQPISYLRLNKSPEWKFVVFVIAILVVSTPAMNYIIHLNESIDLPDSNIEQWMRNTEAAARAVTEQLTSDMTLSSLILVVCLVGILTGIGEEVFFRGALQRIFIQRPINAHLAIWSTAFMFSALHFQFYGFIPRMLLGAFFGYMAWKSRSLWTPIIAHAFNNSIVIISTYMISNGISTSDFNSIGIPQSGEFPILATISLVITAIGILIGAKSIFTKNP